MLHPSEQYRLYCKYNILNLNKNQVKSMSMSKQNARAKVVGGYQVMDPIIKNKHADAEKI